MIAAMSLLAAIARASSGRSSTLGTTSAASTPRITMTTMISISVKPEPVDVRGAARSDVHRTIIMRRSRRSLATRRRVDRRERACRRVSLPARPHAMTLPRAARYFAVACCCCASARPAVAWWALHEAADAAAVAVRVRSAAGRVAVGRRARTAARRACCRTRGRWSRWRACAASTARSRPAATRSTPASRCRSCSAELTQGDVTQTSFAIVEGTTFADVRRALRAERPGEEHGARPAGRAN